MTRRAHVRLLLTGAVAILFAAPVVAQNVSNEAWIGQLGAGNTLDIVQEGRSNSAGADNIYLLLSQRGIGNSLVLLQSGYANKVGTLFGDEVDYARGVWQTGDINSINISQSNTTLGGANTIGAVQQWSRANIIGVGANILSVVQSDTNGIDGTANNYIGRLVQANLTSKANNLADVVQAGGGLNACNILANLYQRGTGNTFALTQTGQSNQLGETIRLGGVWQIGGGNEAYLVQDGERNLVEYVEQSGESNIVRLRQSGDRNAIASIDQDSVGFGEEGNLLSIVISGEDNGGTGSGAVGDFLMVNTMKQPGILQGAFRQYGGDNEASLTITGGAESRYGLTQDGDGNRATVTIISGVPAQLAMRNETAIYQEGSLNVATHAISGDDNAAAISQKGKRNTISVTQDGVGNIADVSFTGNDNNAPSTLFGTALDAFAFGSAGTGPGQVLQEGTAHTAALLVTGSSNGLATQQSGSTHNLRSSITGDFNALVVIQQTSLNAAITAQSGSDNSLGIVQY